MQNEFFTCVNNSTYNSLLQLVDYLHHPHIRFPKQHRINILLLSTSQSPKYSNTYYQCYIGKTGWNKLIGEAHTFHMKFLGQQLFDLCTSWNVINLFTQEFWDQCITISVKWGHTTTHTLFSHSHLFSVSWIFWHHHSNKRPHTPCINPYFPFTVWC